MKDKTYHVYRDSDKRQLVKYRHVELKKQTKIKNADTRQSDFKGINALVKKMKNEHT